MKQLTWLELMYQSNKLSFDTSMSGTETFVEVLSSDTMLGLRDKIRDRRWHADIYSDRDCTGICFQQSCKLLHVERTDAGFSAVVLTSSYFDI